MLALPVIALLVVTVFIRPQEVSEILRKIPLLNLLCLLTLFCFGIDLKLRVIKPNATPQLLWALLFFVWAIINIVIRVPSGSQMPQIIDLFVSLIIFIGVAHAAQSFRSLQLLIAVAVFICLALAAIGVHQGVSPYQCVRLPVDAESQGMPDGRSCENHDVCRYGVGSEPGSDYLCERVGLLRATTIVGRVRYRGRLEDPNELALFLGGGFGLLLGMAMRRRSPGWTTVAILGGLLIFVCVIMTKSRGGQLVFLSVVGTYGVRKYGLKGVLFGAVLAAPVVLLGGRSGSSASTSTMERYEAWAAGFDLIRAHPVLGVGQGMFSDHHYLTAHNSYLLVTAELGVIGAFFWAMVFYLSLKVPFQAIRDFADTPGAAPARTWGMAILASLVGVYIGITFLSMAYHPVTWLFFGISAGLYSAIKRHVPDWRVKLGLADLAIVLAAGFMLLMMTRIMVIMAFR